MVAMLIAALAVIALLVWYGNLATGRRYHRLSRAITLLEDSMTKEFDDIQTALTGLRDSVAEVEGELRGLAAEVAAGKDDPAAMEAVANDIKALAERLHDAYTAPAATPAPATEPAVPPVEPPPEPTP